MKFFRYEKLAPGRYAAAALLKQKGERRCELGTTEGVFQHL